MSNTYHGIDLDDRPETYFWPLDLATHLLATVKGAERQKRIRSLIDAGRLDTLEDWLAHPALDEDTRQAIGRIHPAFMGGEYLPDLLPGEVEIARITLASMLQDVISVRARPGEGQLHYRIVDEYEGEEPKPGRSLDAPLPLTLGELERFIEDAECGISFLQMNYEWGADLDGLEGFLTVTSAFYPDITPLYAQRCREWAKGLAADEDEADEDEVDEDDVDEGVAHPAEVEC